MTSMLQKLLQRVLEDGDMEFSVSSYSGRSMYGKSCLAVIGDNLDLFELGLRVAHAAQFEDDESLAMDDLLYEIGRGTRRDSMGLGIVVYWPSIPYEEETVDNDDAS